MQLGADDLRKGHKIIWGDEPALVTDIQRDTPTHLRVHLLKLLSGDSDEVSLTSHNVLDLADIEELSLSYLYEEDHLWHFTDPGTGEQYTLDSKAMGDAAQYLTDGVMCDVTLWNGKPIHVTPPTYVVLEVVEISSAAGDTSASPEGFSQAVLETGVSIQVPAFVETGNFVKVDTRIGSYVERTNGR